MCRPLKTLLLKSFNIRYYSLIFPHKFFLSHYTLASLVSNFHPVSSKKHASVSLFFIILVKLFYT